MPPRFPFTTTADEAAAELADQIKGKTILIVGISPKILAAVAAQAIAKHEPKLLIFASRTQSKINKVIEDIKAETPGVNIRSLLLDLASQRDAATEVHSYPENIDILINNASVMGVDYALTPEHRIAIRH